MVVPHKALKPRWKSANVSTGWLAQVAVSAKPKRNGVMMRCRRQNFSSVPQALSRGSENTHWNLSATMLSCPWSIWDSFRCLSSNTHQRSFSWIAIKIHNKIKYLKVPTYDAAQYYAVTYDRILKKLVNGSIIHADETKINLQKGSGYVWVLTSMEDVVYLYRPSREADFLHTVLAGFHGVLITDFYTGYDSLPCLQQKCLIHLIRDINDD